MLLNLVKVIIEKQMTSSKRPQEFSQLILLRNVKNYFKNDMPDNVSVVHFHWYLKLSRIPFLI